MIIMGRVKQMTIGVTACALGFIGALVFTGSNDHSHDRESVLINRTKVLQAELRRQIQYSRQQENKIELVTVERTVVEPVGVILDPGNLIQTLIEMNDDGSRSTIQRRIIHYLQSLCDQGQSAVGPIAEFLKRNLDCDYYVPPPQFISNIYALSPDLWVTRPMPAPKFLAAPTLRIGLFEVLGQIGGSESKKVLADCLKTTGRGIEVAVLDDILGRIAPGEYSSLAVESARVLLGNLPKVSDPTLFDQSAKNFLFGVLLKYKDRVHLAHVREHLLNKEGRLDAMHINYLHEIEGAGCISELRKLYGKTDLSIIDRKVARDLAFNYLCVNRQVTYDYLFHVKKASELYQESRAPAMKMELNYLVDQLKRKPRVLNWNVELLADRLRLVNDARVRLNDKNVLHRLEQVKLHLV